MHTSSEPSESIAIVDLLKAFWRRRRLIAVTFAAVVGAGVLYLLVAPRVHRASTRLLLVRRGSEGQEMPRRYDPAFVATHAEIVRSRAVVERALKTFMPPNLSMAEDPVASASAAIHVEPVEGTYVLRISYQCYRSSAASRMLEAVIASYSEYLRNTAEDNQSQTVTFLTETEQRLRKQLEEKEQEYRQLLKDGSLLAVGEESGRVQTAYLSNLGKALTDAKNRRLQMETALSHWTKPQQLARNKGGAPGEMRLTSLTDFSVIDDLKADVAAFNLPQGQPRDYVSEISEIERELRAARQREAELKTRFGSKHPDLRAVNAQIRKLQYRANELLAEIPAILEEELSAIHKHEQELEQLYEQEIERASQIDVEQLENRHHLDTLERLRAAHASIVAEMHTHGITTSPAQGGQAAVHVKTITPPRADPSPAWPIPSIVLAFCSALGLAVGGSFALAMERKAFSGPVSATVSGSGPSSAAL